MFGVSNSNELWISFKDELSAQEIKIDIVKAVQIFRLQATIVFDGWILICTRDLESIFRMVL